jgi:hypothetical protein
MGAKAILSAGISAATLVVAVLALAFGPSNARAATPEIVFQFPVEGDVLKEAPLVLQMCFKEPVDVRDLPPLDEGDFAFSLTRPDGINLGMRIVFQPDGYGVAIYPGNAETEAPEGEWLWTYRLVDRETDEPLEGEVRFTTNAATGEEILQPTPPACLAEGASSQPTSPSGETPSATDSEGSEDDDGTSALTFGLIAIGILAIAAVVAVAAFLFRSRGKGGPPTPGGDGTSSSDGPGDSPDAGGTTPTE